MASTEMTRAAGQVKAMNSVVRSAIVVQLHPALEIAMVVLINAWLDGPTASFCRAEGLGGDGLSQARQHGQPC